MGYRLIVGMLIMAGLIQGADTGVVPGPFLPLPVPSWFGDGTCTRLRVTRVVPGTPTDEAGVVVGDHLVAIGGMHPVSGQELAVVRQIAARRDAWTSVWGRGTGTRTVRLETVLGTGALGIDVDSDSQMDVAANRELRGLLPAGMSAADSAVLPRRAWDEAITWRAAHRDGSTGWWTALLTDLQAARSGSPLADPLIQPTPFLIRLDALYRTLAVAGAGPQPFAELKSCADPDDAWCAALYLPWPTLQRPAAGTITTADPRVAKAFTVMAEGTSSVEANRQLANELIRVMDWKEPVPAFIAQVQAAILDQPRQGAWPTQSAVVADKGRRAVFRHDLSAWAEGHGDLAAMAVLAGIAPAVLDQDWTAVSTALTTLSRTSPWLAAKGLELAVTSAQRSNLLKDCAGHFVHHHPPGMSRAVGLALWLMERGAGPDLLVAAASNRPNPGLDALGGWLAWWSDGMLWRATSLLNGRVGDALNNLCWWLAADPLAADGPGALMAARQMLAVRGLNIAPYQVDTVGGAFARAGDFPGAIRWQQAALRRLNPGNNQSGEYQTHLDAFLAGRPWTDQGLDPQGAHEDTQARGGGRSRRGRLIDGVAHGVWRTTNGEGRVVEEIAYVENEPRGGFSSWDDQGRLRWSGFVTGGSRLGWWRIAVGDGGMAEGWYDGRNGGSRIGWWTIRDAEGVARAAGLCVDGRPMGRWTSVAADGTSAVVGAGGIVLPDDPALPIGFGETFGADKF